MTSERWDGWRPAMLGLIFLPALVLFCIGGLTAIDVPGLYMDAINPDYAVVGVLNPASHIDSWFLPGTLLFGRWPAIGQIYHGALPFYVGLPFYALFGTGVSGVRVTNMMFGCLIILAAGALLRAFRVRPVIASACLILLALDPEFLFSFRTQFYITLLPIALIFASAALVEARRDNPSRKTLFLAGLCAGLACYGYFIFMFLIPAVACLTLYRWRRQPLGRWFLWPLGFCVGVAPYLVGFIAIMCATGGVHGLVAFVHGNVQSLNVQGPSQSVMQRLAYIVYLLHGTILDIGPSLMMLQTPLPLTAPLGKIMLLLAVPAVALLSGLAHPRRIVGLLFCLGLLAGFFALVMTFGGRLWFHHGALLIPVLYVALAFALDRFAICVPAAWSPRVALLCGLAMLPFMVANACDRQAMFRQLRLTGGVGLTSDALDHFAQDARHETASTHFFFPDWGVFPAFAMITHGTLPYVTRFSVAEARAALCQGQDAVVATVVAPSDHRLQQWTAALAWPSETSVYRQHNGVAVLNVTRWKAQSRPAGACS